MTRIFLPFHELTPLLLADALRLRQRVFIIEQQCFYEDIDGADKNAHHLFFYEDDILAGYLRIFAPGLNYKEASLGRIVVDPAFRGTRLGNKLIKSGIEECKTLYNSSIRIEAQAALERYYENLGFVSQGKIYIVDDIPHRQMVLS